MKRHVYLFAAALPLALWAGQGCSSSGDTVGSDGGGGGGGTDGGGGGGDVDGSGGGPNGDGGSTKKDGGGGNGEGGTTMTTPGTQLANVPDAQLVGVTTGGMVVYLNFNPKMDAGGNPSLEAVPIAGGTPTVISPSIGQTDDFAVFRDVVAVWTNVDQNTLIGALNVWSAASGKLTAVSTATASFDGAQTGLFDASEDGKYVVYSKAAVAAAMTPTTTQLAVAKIDGTGEVVFNATAAHVDNQNCFPFVLFKKSVAVAQYCTTKAATTGPVDVIDTGVAGPARVNLGTATPGVLGVDDNATNVLWSKAGVGQVTTKDGNTNVVIDKTKMTEGLLNTDATRAIYVQQPVAGGSFLKVQPVTAGATPFTLSSGIAGILGAAHDYTTVAVHRTSGETLDAGVNVIDIAIANAADAGNPTPLVDAGVPVGYATANGYFFYLSDLDPSLQFAMGTLKAHPLASGADKTIATGALFPTLVDATTKVVWLQNIQQVGMSAVVDIAAADAAGAGTPTVVVQGADPTYFVSGSKIAYYSAGMGIYAVAVP
jgi:hypothetical protein